MADPTEPSYSQRLLDAAQVAALNLWDARPALLRPSQWLPQRLPPPDPGIEPIVFLGEMHEAPEHVQIELEALKSLKALRPEYDTVALELPRNLQPTFDRYISSARTEDDYHALLHGMLETVRKNFRDKSPEEQEEGIERLAHHPNQEHARALLNGILDLKAGYRIVLDDLSSESGFTQSKRPLQYLAVRNAGIAFFLAEEARKGHGIVAIQGAHHLSEIVPGCSLKLETARQRVPSFTFDLALDGKRPLDEEYRKFHRRPQPVDYVVADGAEVGRIVAENRR